jgi:hypothetical protein
LIGEGLLNFLYIFASHSIIGFLIWFFKKFKKDNFKKHNSLILVI